MTTDHGVVAFNLVTYDKETTEMALVLIKKVQGAQK